MILPGKDQRYARARIEWATGDGSYRSTWPSINSRLAQAWYRKKSHIAAKRFFQETNRTIERLRFDPTSYPT